MMQFYYIPLGCSLACHIVLEEVGVEFEPREMRFERGDMDDPAFRALNPKGFVPVLVTGQGILTENAAILLYLAHSFPEAGLLPGPTAFDAARLNAFNVFLSNSVHVTYRHLSRPTLFADGAEAAAALAAKVPEMTHRYFGMIEQQLADGRPWIHGDSYSASDPYLFVYASYLQWGDRGDPERFPLVRAHRERVLARPAAQRAIDREGTGDPARVYGGDNLLGSIDAPESRQRLADAAG